MSKIHILMLSLFVSVFMFGQVGFADSHKASDAKPVVKAAGEEQMGSKKQIALSERATMLLEKQAKEIDSKRIPKNVRDAAKCIIVFPSVIKAGLLVGGKKGKGLASCRKPGTNVWGAPVYVNMDAASVGIQAGISKASLILILLDQKAVDEFLNPEIKLGTNVEIAPGPVGRVADLSEHPSVLSYVRTKGLFAGVDLERSYTYIVKPSTQDVYGNKIDFKEILFLRKEVPPRFEVYMQALNDFAPLPASALQSSVSNK